METRLRKEAEEEDGEGRVGVKEIKNEFLREESRLELPKQLKQKIMDEILGRLRRLSADANLTEQREAVERWRKEKLKEATQVTLNRTLNSTVLPGEAGMFARALESGWSQLSEDIGLWIPVEILNEEHDDKPEGAEDEDEEILPGRQVPPECHAELHSDYDGIAVRWGLTHHRESAADCCQACLDHARNAKPGRKTPIEFQGQLKRLVASNFSLSTMLSDNNLVHKTLYDILGVREDANYEEIRTSYRSAILDSHPDKMQKASKTYIPDHELENRFLEVQSAWEVLSHPKSRASYDSDLRVLRLEEFVVAEDVGLEDMMVQSKGEVLELFYQCRCSDYFSIDSLELEEMGYRLLREGSKISLRMSDALSSSVLLSCGSCSLQIRLLINGETTLETNDPFQ
ncbi:hypothetical protein RHMOL_Rhmol06G0059900 [Rhododendron molle]|uniref:Uncharacterized protein n=1 Tax=Rhododendron molle TaxID=49168 RepID=A0ACC0N9L2_RHOML|nr:hypothetical protein RHMOL_Rhmol06G0059900 [Rhododendron molle]